MSAITVTAFSRGMRRRAGQAQRTGRGFTPPGPGRPRAGGSCCLFVILLIVALIVYAYIEAYVLKPQPTEEEQSRAAQQVVAADPEYPVMPQYFIQFRIDQVCHI